LLFAASRPQIRHLKQTTTSRKRFRLNIRDVAAQAILITASFTSSTPRTTDGMPALNDAAQLGVAADKNFAALSFCS
jgi:hypothetical protein